jgi:hypothetical protein
MVLGGSSQHGKENRSQKSAVSDPKSAVLIDYHSACRISHAALDCPASLSFPQGAKL